MDCVLIFSLEIADVILCVYRLNVLRELMKRLCGTGLIGQLQSQF